MAAPPRCWSHYRCNLYTAPPAEKAGGEIKCLTLLTGCWFVWLLWFYAILFPGYLAVLRQEHGLGVTEGLPDSMLGIGAVGVGDRVAQRHHVQGVGGEGALHALTDRGCMWTGEGGTKQQQRRKCWFTACKRDPTGEPSCAQRQLHHKWLSFKRGQAKKKKHSTKQQEKIKHDIFFYVQLVYQFAINKIGKLCLFLTWYLGTFSDSCSLVFAVGAQIHPMFIV